jgi:hypothetical protein
VKKLLVVAVLLLASACGVKPTPVVAAGPAPTLRSPGTEGGAREVILYFVRDGRLAPVTRQAATVAGAGTALSMLLDGPSGAESSDGYATMLPPRTGPISLDPGPPTVLTFAFPLKQLGAVARNQLLCTAFAALADENTYAVDGTITLVGTDVDLPGQTCQAF